MRKLLLLFVSTAMAVASSLVQAQVQAEVHDHAYRAWEVLLKKHVVVQNGGRSSLVRYAEFSRDRAALKSVLDSLSRVSEAEFERWSRPQRMAFLINAYNAFTVELILAHYPVKSIKDIGSDLFDNRWKRRFFSLLGKPASLDQVEHEMLRKPGAYDEPRVHFAVNCASIGCPMLREEAYVAEKLERQLEEQAIRFLSDRSRNRWNADRSRLEVSKIFDWFKVDWTSGYRGFEGRTPPVISREAYFSGYARLLTDSPAGEKLIAEGKSALSFLDYDWSLNELRP